VTGSIISRLKASIRILSITLAVFSTVLVENARSWNDAGHMIVNLVAYDLIDAPLRQKAVDLLRQHPRFEQHFMSKMPEEIWSANDAKKNEWIFAFAANWPDLVRRASNVVTDDDVLKFNRPSWHYVDFPVFLNQTEEQHLTGTLHINLETEPPVGHDEPTMNVIQAIKNSSRIVADKSAPAADRALHLAWLCHVVGDAHQPLHSTALYTSKRFREGDQGGNLLHIGEKKSVHSYWDGRVLSSRDYAAIRQAAKTLGHNESFKKAGEAGAAVADPAAWISEDHEIARTKIYTDKVRQMVAAGESNADVNLPNITLSPEYDREAGEIVRQRIVMTGYRLAEVLKRVLDN
jgi:hypothetical protein